MKKNPKVPEKDKCQPNSFGLFHKLMQRMQRYNERQYMSLTDCEMTQNTDDIYT